MKLTKKNCIYIGVTLFILYLSIHYWESLIYVIKVLLGAATPLILGAIMAYIVNILMSFYERYYPFKKYKRLVCMLGALVTLIGCALLIIGIVVPQLVSCITTLVKQLPGAIDYFFTLMHSNGYTDTLITSDVEASLTSMDWETMMNEIILIFENGFGDAFSSIVNIASSVFSVVTNVFIGVVFMIHLLIGKEKINNQVKRTMKVYLPEKINDNILYGARVFDNCFHNFIVGQCTEALILGGLCVIGMLILQLPYAIMIGTFIGFTALIPVAGAYIGGAVGFIMILTESPIQAIIFLIFLFLLQQFEEKFIYPKVVGSSIGLTPMWVLMGITLGGGVLGIAGMLIGVPLVASIYAIVKNDVNRKEEKA